VVFRGTLTLSMLALAAVLAGPVRAQTDTVAIVVPACRSDADALVRDIAAGSGVSLIRREGARDDELTLEVDARVCAPGARVGLVVRVGEDVRLSREMVLDPETDPGRSEALVLTLAEWVRWALRDAAARDAEARDAAARDAEASDTGAGDEGARDAAARDAAARDAEASDTEARDDAEPSEPQRDDTSVIDEAAPDVGADVADASAPASGAAASRLASPLAPAVSDADGAPEPSGGGARALGSPFLEPRPRTFAIGASFIARGHLDRGTVLLGGEVRARVPVASPFALHVGLALLGNDVPLASVGRATTTALGGVLGLGLTLLRLTWLELSIEAEVSLAWTRISGATSDIGYLPATLDGTTLLAGAQASLAFFVDRGWAIELRLGGGGAIVSLAGDVDGRRGVGTGGGFLDARLGLALSL
jgi:hypothetical protein